MNFNWGCQLLNNIFEIAEFIDWELRAKQDSRLRDDSSDKNVNLFDLYLMHVKIKGEDSYLVEYMVIIIIKAN